MPKIIAAGIFAVWKTKGLSSYDVIRQLKRRIKEKRVGHAGTLDPLAEGILVVGVGREATKKLGTITTKEKEYLAKIKLGEVSATDDAEGPITKIRVGKKPALKQINHLLSKFEGKIRQQPPRFSALKIKGQPAYALARQGIEPLLKARQVEIKKIKILSYRWPYLKLKIITGPGVYIRALARDLGRRLKCGGYLAGLKRTRVGRFTKKSAVKL